MIFNKLDVPAQWQTYFTKYPHGFTIFEALAKWVTEFNAIVSNVNEWNTYLDNFVANFEFDLQSEVASTLSDWQADGTLDLIIQSAIDVGIGDRQYTEQNFISNGETITNSLNALDVGIGNRLTNITIYPSDYGFVGDGINNDSVALNSMFSVIPDNSMIQFPKNSIIRLDDDIVVNKSVNIDFNNSIINSYSPNGLKFQGTLKSTHTVVSDYDKTTSLNKIVLNNVTGISIGDLINIKSTELYDTSRLYYIKGINALVTKIDGNTVYFNHQMPFDITANTITVSIYTPVTVHISNITMMQGKNDLSLMNYGIFINYGINCTINNVALDKFKENIRIYRCVNVLLANIHTGNAKNSDADVWDGYGIDISSCTMVNCDNIITNSGQHGITTSGQEPSYNINISNSILKDEIWGLGIGMHENTVSSSLTNCVTFGFLLAGNVSAINCDFLKPEFSVRASFLALSEFDSKNNYTFNKCRFGTDLTVRDYTQVDAPTRKYINNIVINNSPSLVLKLEVNARTNGDKVASINKVEINNCDDLIVVVHDQLNELIINNCSYRGVETCISQLPVGDVYQKIGLLLINNINIPQRYDSIKLFQVGILIIDGLYQNDVDNGNDRLTFMNIDKAILNNINIKSNSTYGINSTSTFGELTLNDCTLRSIGNGLETIYKATSVLSGRNITDNRTTTRYNLETATNGDKYKITVDSTGTQVNTKII